MAHQQKPLEDIATTEIAAELQRRLCDNKKPTRVIFLGPPGSGRATQTPGIREKYCLCNLTVGSILKAASGAEQAVDQNGKVSDKVAISAVKAAIAAPECKQGFILNGFPRTEMQAQMLSDMLSEQSISIDKVINFKVPEQVSISRIAGRRIHSPSGRSYHTSNAAFSPQVPGKDDVTGEPLIQRKDDTLVLLKQRLASFHKETPPVLAYYGSKVASINATGDRSTIKEATIAALGSPYAK